MKWGPHYHKNCSPYSHMNLIYITVMNWGSPYHMNRIPHCHMECHLWIRYKLLTLYHMNTSPHYHMNLEHYCEDLPIVWKEYPTVIWNEMSSIYMYLAHHCHTNWGPPCHVNLAPHCHINSVYYCHDLRKNKKIGTPRKLIHSQYVAIWQQMISRNSFWYCMFIFIFQMVL